MDTVKAFLDSRYEVEEYEERYDLADAEMEFGYGFGFMEVFNGRKF